MHEREKAFVKAFIIREKQPRYLELLASPKRRSRFLDRLSHALDFNPVFAIHVAPSAQTAEIIAGLLRQKGAPDTCSVISTQEEWDGREMALTDALDAIGGGNVGTVLCCVPGRLAYYEAEGLGERYVLSR